jgi:suppressor for copper-sensitivity B
MAGHRLVGRHVSRSRTSHAIVILGAVNANRNPFIYLKNMGEVMTSGVLIGLGALALAASFAFPIGSEARADTGAWAESAHARARLVAAAADTGKTRIVGLGLEIKLEPGWKTYWRAPGEGGMPPRFDWTGSANLAQIAIVWPVPQRFEIGGMESLGYADHVILPLDMTLAKAGEPVAARLLLHYAVCREICMLVEARLALDLPAGAAGKTPPPSSNAGEIARFRARAPRAGETFDWLIAGVRGHRLGGPGAEGRDVVVIDVANDGEPFAHPELLIEGPPGLRFGKAVTKLGPDGRRARFVAPVQAQGPAAPGTVEIVLTLIDAERAGTFTIKFEPPGR